MKRLNLQVFIEIICFLGFAILLTFLVLSGRYVNYVNPRLLPFIWVTIILLILWSVNRLRYLPRRTHRIQLTHCYSILLPFFLLLIPLGQIKSSTLPNSYVDASQLSQIIGTTTSTTKETSSSEEIVDNSVDSQPSPDTNNNEGSTTLPDDNQTTIEESVATNDQGQASMSEEERLSAPFIIDGLNTVDKVITINDDYFLPWLSELSGNLDLYVGYTVEIKAFVYVDSTIMETDDFSMARMLMSCCTADLTPFGLLATHQLDRNILVDQWYLMRGVLSSKTFQGQTVPYLIINQAERVSKPVVEYVYP